MNGQQLAPPAEMRRRRSFQSADRAALVETEAAASSERGAAEAIARALRSRRAGPLELTVGLARSAAAD
jgi:hypothetical protein